MEQLLADAEDTARRLDALEEAAREPRAKS